MKKGTVCSALRAGLAMMTLVLGVAFTAPLTASAAEQEDTIISVSDGDMSEELDGVKNNGRRRAPQAPEIIPEETPVVPEETPVIPDEEITDDQDQDDQNQDDQNQDDQNQDDQDQDDQDQDDQNQDDQNQDDQDQDDEIIITSIPELVDNTPSVLGTFLPRTGETSQTPWFILLFAAIASLFAAVRRKAR